MTCDGFQLHIWRIGQKQTMRFISGFYNKVALRLTADMILQSETEKQMKNKISEKKVYNMSDFEFKLQKRVRY